MCTELQMEQQAHREEQHQEVARFEEEEEEEARGDLLVSKTDLPGTPFSFH